MNINRTKYLFSTLRGLPLADENSAAGQIDLISLDIEALKQRLTH